MLLESIQQVSKRSSKAALDAPANCRLGCKMSIRQCLARQQRYPKRSADGGIRPMFMSCQGCEHWSNRKNPEEDKVKKRLGWIWNKGFTRREK